MHAIKFKVEGILNSFRIPFFRTYHKTFLAPPKTTVIGLLTNVLRKSEKWYYEILHHDIFEVSVVIDEISGKTKDLWGYKTLKKNDMRGRSVIRRDKLYKAKYTIYLKLNEKNITKYLKQSPEDFKTEIMQALKSPKCIPALGLDDEIIKIYTVEELELRKSEQKIINSVFIGDEVKYTVKMQSTDIDEDIYLPTSNVAPLKYVIDEKKGLRTKREVTKEGKQVEYINCKVELFSEIDIYEDKENKVVFY